MSRSSKILRTGTLALLLAALAALWLWHPKAGRSQAAAGPVQLPDGPFVALTFDDGPKADTTSALLDGLSQRGIHATFFII